MMEIQVKHALSRNARGEAVKWIECARFYGNSCTVCNLQEFAQRKTDEVDDLYIELDATQRRAAEAEDYQQILRMDLAKVRAERDEERNSSQVAQEGMTALLHECKTIEAERDEAKREIATDDVLLADRNRILDFLPCPTHGPCVPHVIQEIKRLQKVEAERDALKAEVNYLKQHPHDFFVKNMALKNERDRLRSALLFIQEKSEQWQAEYSSGERTKPPQWYHLGDKAKAALEGNE